MDRSSACDDADLSRLGRREGAVLVEGLAGNNALTEEITAEIVERTDGIPLFVEELTKAVLEAGLHAYDGARTVRGAASGLLFLLLFTLR